MENSNNVIDDLLDSITPLEQEKVDAKMLIAAKIAELMKMRDWKAKDILEAVGKSNPSVVTKWLSGTHNFTIDSLVEIGHALDAKFLDLSLPSEAVNISTFHTSRVVIVSYRSSADFGLTVQGASCGYRNIGQKMLVTREQGSPVSMLEFVGNQPR